MKVGHVISDYLPRSSGGTQLHLRDLCRAQRQKGIQCVIFAGERGSEAPEFGVQRDQYDGVELTLVTNNFRDFDRFDRLYVHPKIDARFDAWLEQEQPDLVHVHHVSGLSTGIVEVAKARGIPVVLTLHDHWLVCPRGQRIHPETLEICESLDRSRCHPCLAALWPHLLHVDADPENLSGAKIERWESAIRRTLSACALLISPSEFHRERFLEFGVEPWRIHTIEHGLDRAFLEQPPRDRPVRRIGFVGTVLPSKGVHVLVDAFAQLARPELELRIHGEIANFHGDTSYGDRLRGAAEGLNVGFAGGYAHDELPTLLRELDLLVVPSIWWESFCLTIREGALAGLPTVASYHGAMAEAVDAGIAKGFRPGDAGDLARVLADLIDDAPARAALVAASARIRAMEDCANETIEHYERVLAAR